MTKLPPSRGHRVRLLLDASVVLMLAPVPDSSVTATDGTKREPGEGGELLFAHQLTREQILRCGWDEGVGAPVRIVQLEMSRHDVGRNQEGDNGELHC